MHLYFSPSLVYNIVEFQHVNLNDLKYGAGNLTDTIAGKLNIGKLGRLQT